ncbi:hypothetical protein KIL84_009843, partial [Mauremys mutica]
MTDSYTRLHHVYTAFPAMFKGLHHSLLFLSLSRSVLNNTNIQQALQRDRFGERGARWDCNIKKKNYHLQLSFRHTVLRTPAPARRVPLLAQTGCGGSFFHQIAKKRQQQNENLESLPMTSLAPIQSVLIGERKS